MKNIFLILLFFLVNMQFLSADKIVYGYDHAGNRISRTITLDSATTIRKSPIDTMLVHNESGFDKIRIYPNPTHGFLIVNVPVHETELTNSIQLYDAKGQLLLTQTARNGENSVNMHDFIPGWYVLRLMQGDNISEFKIIKK